MTDYQTSDQTLFKSYQDQQFAEYNTQRRSEGERDLYRAEVS